MHYFSNVKLGQKVFSLIYGKGTVIFTLPKEHRLEGFYIFAAEYKKNNKVYYTVDGFPNWSDKDICCQTVFYKDDVDINNMDTMEHTKVPSEKQILKWKENSTLEIQCPSGIWRNVEESPDVLIKKALKKAKYYLFRKQEIS